MIKRKNLKISPPVKKTSIWKFLVVIFIIVLVCLFIIKSKLPANNTQKRPTRTEEQTPLDILNTGIEGILGGFNIISILLFGVFGIFFGSMIVSLFNRQ